ncbi:unnamed protein product [Cuscuta campestris]|uniref:Uncharacterized protein n=1 Tax=Cuscuta campestris TaxID=132261 RepID=A0A484NE63_9ASTE|nr:unnamed protein product [Cuscuta campestris]
MAASSESGCSSKVRCYYETRVFTPENVDDEDPDSSFKAAHPIAAAAASPGTASSSSVLFKVQSILRLSVAGGNPMTEFLEENDWREARQSSLELPCSKDGIIIDDKDNLKIISEALTALRVLKVSHQSIMDQLRQGAASLGLSPKFVVEICEVTHVTLPLIDEEGKRFMEEGETVLIPHNGDDEGESVLIPENGDDEGQAVLIPDNDYEEKKKKRRT